METEIWKKHPEIEKLEVSTFGRVRSVRGHYYKSLPNNCGYLQVFFRMNGKLVSKLVHRLVAQVFISNPNNLQQVNHRDGNRSNNNVSNLEWCTASYNQKYRNKHGVSQTEAAGHPLFAVNLNTLKASRFRSQHEAGRELGLFDQNIRAVIKGRRNSTGGFWFVNDDDKATDAIKNKLHKIRKDELEHIDILKTIMKEI